MLDKKLIKSLVSIEQVAQFYNLQFDNNGWCKCPFHSDENPSMSINGNHKGKAHCFVCGKSWDIIDFVKEKEQIDFQEALVFLDNVFKLNLGNQQYSKTSLEEIYRKQRVELAKKERLKKLALYQKSVVNKILELYNKYIDMCIRTEYQPKLSMVDWSNKISNFYFKALKMRDYYYNLYSFIQGIEETRFDLEIDRVEFMRKLFKGEMRLDELFY